MRWPWEKPKPKATRGKSRSGADKLDYEIGRTLAELRKSNPELAQQFALQSLQKKLGIKQEKEQSEIESIIKTIKDMQGAGLWPQDPSRMGGGWLDQLMRGIGESAGPLVAQLAVQAQQAQQAKVIEQPPPAQLAASNPVAPEVASVPVQPAPEQSEVKMSILSQYVIGQLDGKTPEQAAAWLQAQQNQQAQMVVATLAKTPDDQLLVLLQQIATQVPDFAGLVAWLRQRPGWLVEVVRILRKPADAKAASALGL